MVPYAMVVVYRTRNRGSTLWWGYIYVTHRARAWSGGRARACERVRACVTRVGVRDLTWRAETAHLARRQSPGARRRRRRRATWCLLYQ